MKEKISPSDWSFVIAEAIEIHGRLDSRQFIAALRILTEELEATRSRIRDIEGRPHQVILGAYDGDIPLLDFSAEREPLSVAYGWMNAEHSKPIDVAEHWLWASALLKVSDVHWIWYHSAHHALIDGFSGGLIARRVSELYEALQNGRSPSPCDFGSPDELLAIERDYRGSVHFGRDRRYWLDQLKSLPQPVTLARRKIDPCGGILRHSVELDREMIRRVAALGRAAGGSLPQTLIALVATYYAKAADVDELTILTMVTARISADLRRMPGMLANAVPLRFSFGPEVRLADVIHQTSQQMARALRYQRYRYEDMRRDLGLSHRDEQIATLGVNIEPFDYSFDFNGLPATARNLSNGTTADLTIFAYDRGDGRSMIVDFDANPALYSLSELVDHQKRFVQMIEAILAEPERPIASRSLLLPQERERVLLEWNATGRPIDPLCLPVLFRHQVERTPQSPAVVFGDRQLSYRALDVASDAWARHLASKGVAPGDLVAVAVPRSEAMVVVLLAILKIGASYLPLDPSDHSNRLSVILDEAKPVAIVTTSTLASETDLGTTRQILLDRPIAEGDGDLPKELLTEGPSSQDLAYVIFTSGSTGRPKGVQITHQSLTNFLMSMRELIEIKASDRLLAVTTIAFDIAALELFLPLICGATTVVAPRDTVRQPAALRRLIAEQRISILQATPSLWRALVNDGGTELRNVLALVGGEALSPDLAHKMAALRAPVINLYGPTESTVWSTAMALKDGDLSTVPIGRPIWNTQVYVVDRHGQPVPPGFVGELLIGGMGVARGYLDRPELTEERFVPDRFTANGGKLYRTGDLARWRADGVLEYLGRNDFQIKIRGFRIEPGEIEQTLMNHPGIRQAVVMLREDPGRNKRLVAYVVPAEAGQDLDPRILSQHLAQHLPSHMIPAHYVRVAELPLNGNGKIDRKALPAPQVREGEETVAPRNETERALAALWCEVLGLKNVGVHDDFFALGGDSLAAAGMVSALRSRVQGEIPLGVMFETPTIAALAERLEVANEASSLMAPMLPIKATGNREPLFCIHPILGLSWSFFSLGQHVGEDVPIYALQSDGLLDPTRTPESIEAMAERYLERIRSRQPHGPYHLLGWSLGGLIAHEMARRLLDNNETVAFLGMLDSYKFRPDSLLQDETTLVHAALGFLGSSDEAAKGIDTLEALGDHVVERFYRRNADVLNHTGLDDPKLVERARQTILRNLELAGRFVPGHVDVDLHFFRAGRVMAAPATRAVIEHEPQSWLPHIGGRIYLRTLDCGHDEMLDADPAAEIGAVVQSELLRSILVLRHERYRPQRAGSSA